MDPRLLGLYETELAFLRDMGSEFAAEFPKIAGRLNLASLEVADPYVERLLEGFAFLAALYGLVYAIGKLYFGPAGQLKIGWLPNWVSFRKAYNPSAISGMIGMSGSCPI